MGVRQEASRLDPQGVASLQRAFARAYGIRDERGFGYFAGLHGLPLPNSCPHNTLLFLPWHRAYLYFFERSLQDLDAGANLPWWDWTTATAHRDGIPATFLRTEGRYNKRIYNASVPTRLTAVR
jgi:tyrosinase